jgi:hypothetical protein
VASAVRAAEVARGAGYRVMYGRALTALAAARLAAGCADAAAGCADEALAVHVETGHRLGEARTLALLGAVHAGTAAGDGYRRRSAALLAELGVPWQDGWW